MVHNCFFVSRTSWEFPGLQLYKYAITIARRHNTNLLYTTLDDVKLYLFNTVLNENYQNYIVSFTENLGIAVLSTVMTDVRVSHSDDLYIDIFS